MTAPLRVLGIRHHSPACARLVRRAIEELSPAFVLIEGPFEMNERLDELLLDHTPPVAVYSYRQEQGRSRAGWTPFCDYSPEWIALREGAAAGAEVRFIDRRAWDERPRRNRYGDGPSRFARATEALCRRVGVDGFDALWDHLFEQPRPDLEEALGVFFDGVRGGEGPSEVDALREAFMARCIAWAVDQDRGPVLVVVGGFHRAALRAAVDGVTDRSWPPAEPDEPGVRRGSFLVPYSFERLDSFEGYEAGMPSPAYHQAVWEDGPEAAAETLLEAAVTRLREREQVVSSADLVAVRTLAEGLARLRGHPVLGRTDLLDGLAAGLVKEVQDTPLPWTRRGPLRPGTDPLLAEIVRALRGTRRGALDPATPQPPLWQDVEGELARLDLLPRARPRIRALQLLEAEDRERSHCLHRLRILAIPGFTRVAGPTSPLDAELEERWRLEDALRHGAVLEAAVYGASLEAAAMARLEEATAETDGDLAHLTDRLADALLAGLEPLLGAMLETLRERARRETDLWRLGEALHRLVSVHRHGEAKHDLSAVLVAVLERGLWLLEGVRGGSSPQDQGLLVAVRALRDVLRFVPAISPAVLERTRGVMRRRAVDEAAPPALRGAAFGFLWSLGEGSERAATRALRRATTPATLGDWLSGCFALAREEVLRGEEEEGPTLLAVLHEQIAALPREAFLGALPALRLAFGFFPPREKERVAGRVAALSGVALADPRRWLEADAQVRAEGLALEERVDAVLAHFGLADDGREPADAVPESGTRGARRSSTDSSGAAR